MHLENQKTNIQAQEKRNAILASLGIAAMSALLAVTVQRIDDNAANARVMAAPEIPLDTCLPGPTPGQSQDITDEFLQSYEDVPLEKAKADAEVKGLHFPKKEDTKKLTEDLEIAKDHTEAVALASQYFESTYGIKIALGADAASIVASEKLPDFVESLDRMAQYISVLPIELVKAVNTPVIIIESTLRDGAAATFNPGIGNPGDRVIKILPAYMRFPSVMMHELLGHGIQNTACEGNLAYDIPYTRFNTPGFVYSEDYYPGANMHPEISATSYGLTSPAEDYAEATAKALVDSSDVLYSLLTNTTFPDKLAVIGHRWDVLAPGSLDYINVAKNTLRGFESQAVEDYQAAN